MNMEQASQAAIAAGAGAGAASSNAVAAAGYAWPFVGGAIAVGIGFAVAWPKNAKEGVSRIVATIATSVLAGEAFVAWVYAQTTFDFLPHSHKTELLLTVVAGLPAWWLLGWAVKFLEQKKAEVLP